MFTMIKICDSAALNKKLLSASIDDSFKRLIEKKYLRRIRLLVQ